MRTTCALLSAAALLVAATTEVPASTQAALASGDVSVQAVSVPIVYMPVGGVTINTPRPTIVWHTAWPNDPLVGFTIRLCANDSAYGMLIYETGSIGGTVPIYTLAYPPPKDTQLYAFVWEEHLIGGGIGWSPTGTGGFRISTSMPGPAPLASFGAIPGDHQVTLSWRNPTSTGFTGTMIRYKTTGCPVSVTDGTLVVDKAGAPGATDSYVHAGLDYGTYYYSAFAHDATPNYATQLYAMAVPIAIDTEPPGPVVKFEALKHSGRNVLLWRNPYDADFAGTMVRYKTTGYPTGPTDGTLLIDKSGSPAAADVCEHTGILQGVAHYYAAFAHDGTPNYAAGIGATASELAWPCLRIHPENPHYFQDVATGKPVMITGYASIVPSSLDYDYAAGIADLAGRRIGYSRVWHFLPWSGSNAVWPWGRSGVSGAPMGGNKIDMNTWNETYWTRMRDALFRADEGAMIGEIHLFDRCGMSWPSNWLNNPWASDNNINNLETPPASSVGIPDFYYYSTKPNLRNQQERYVRKMIDETIIYPNVIYEIENEHLGAPSVGWADHYSQFVKDYITASYPSSPRLVSYSTIVSQADLDSCFSMPALDIVNKHIGSGGASAAEINSYLEPRWSYNKAINVDEFANGLGDPDVLRMMCWTIVTSGGNYHIEDCGLSAKPFDICENIRSFLAASGWDFIHAAPNHNLVTYGEGYCMAQPGVEYICYFPSGGGKTVNVGAGAYREEWWNPATGGFYNVTSFSHAGGNRAFNTPDGSDWVLHLATQPAPTTVLEAKTAGAITIDGSSSDWDLAQFTGKITAGNVGTGQIAVIGYDTNGICYQGNHASTGQYPPASPADHAVKVYSRHDAANLYFLVRCDDSDVWYANGVDANYLNDCVEVYIDPSHDHGSAAMNNSISDALLVIDANNQRNVYYCADAYKNQVLAGVASAVLRDSTGWWLEARIAKPVFAPALPVAGTIGIDFNFRDNDNNNDSAQTTVYTWRDSSGDGFPSRAPNRWGDLDLQSAPDATPPGPVTDFVAYAGNQHNILSWINPTVPDFAGVKVLAKTTGYPTGPADGAVVYDGTGTSCEHTSLANGMTYYYAAYAYDGVPNYSTAAQVSGAPTYFTPADAKLLGDNTQLTLTVGVVSAVFGDSFYAQCVDVACGVCGVKVVKPGHGVEVGQSATVKGTILTDSATGERYISATWVDGSGSSVVEPLGLANPGLGGSGWNYSAGSGAGQQGVEGGVGVNNIGLLLRVWGEVTQLDTTGLAYFYIDDGANLSDTTITGAAANVGVRVKADPTGYAAGTHVVVTAISSCFKDASGRIRPQMIPISVEVVEP